MFPALIAVLPTGPFTLGRSLGTLPATKLKAGNTCDFAFTLEDLLGTTTTTQIQAQLLAHKSSTPSWCNSASTPERLAVARSNPS